MRVLRGRGGAGDLTSPGGIAAVDYHTAGEPFRIVTGGVPPLEGRTILEKRRLAAERLDAVRRLLVYEPRGHADMYGCFVTEPEDEGADLGVVFFHNAGYSTACGHGTIALVTWALESGRVVAEGPEARVVVDVPSGRLETVARDRRRSGAARCASGTFPSFVAAEGLEAEGLRCDVAFGGRLLCLRPLPASGAAAGRPGADRAGAGGQARARGAAGVRPPEEPELRNVYGVDLLGAGGRRPAAAAAKRDGLRRRRGRPLALRERNVGAARAPRRGGRAPARRELVHESVIGTEFRAWVVGETPVAGVPPCSRRSKGAPSARARHEFTLDPNDPLAEGFLLR